MANIEIQIILGRNKAKYLGRSRSKDLAMCFEGGVRVDNFLHINVSSIANSNIS